jgi:hypothetical protein
MKLRRYTKNNLKLEGCCTTLNNTWTTTFNITGTPFTMMYRIDGLPDKIFHKIDFDVGNFKIITNELDKQGILPAFCTFTYNKVNNTTIEIQASAYCDNNVYISPIIMIDVPIQKSSKNYIDPTDFKNKIVSFYTSGIISNELAENVQLLATRLAFKPCFINYTYREDMIGDAIIKMIKALQDKKFDPEKGNAFSYFTKIAFHAFCNRIKKEKKEKETINAYQEDVFNVLIESGVMPHPKNCNNGEEGDSFED